MAPNFDEPIDSLPLIPEDVLKKGKPGDLLPQLTTGDLILTSERLIFEAEKIDDAPDLEIALSQVRAVSSGWIRIINLIPFDERVRSAMKRIYASRSWTDPQRRWLARIG